MPTTAFIGKHELVKGSMTLVDTDRALYLYQALGGAVEMSGGSAANTMCGVASFGGTAAYIGKVSDDELGGCSATTAAPSACSSGRALPAEDTPTGRCIIVVTPDAQRTMNTYLGVSSLLNPGDIDADTVAVGRGAVHGGLPLRPPEAKEAFRYAAEVAHANDRQVSLTLSDSFCVDRHRDDFRALVDRRGRPAVRQRGRADVAVRGRDDGRGRRAPCARDCALAVDHGRCRRAAWWSPPTTCCTCPREPVEQVLDTTGAGDLFAAGFLYGYTRRRSLADCAQLGAIAAAEVISHVGPRPLVELRTLLP